jgi:hypothetical protein
LAQPKITENVSRAIDKNRQKYPKKYKIAPTFFSPKNIKIPPKNTKTAPSFFPPKNTKIPPKNTFRQL